MYTHNRRIDVSSKSTLGFSRVGSICREFSDSASESHIIASKSIYSKLTLINGPEKV